MKNILIAFLLLAGLSMNGQTLSNPNFESWGIGTTYSADILPTNWWPFSCNTVSQTTDSYQGTYATKIQGWMGCGIAPGVLVNGQEPVVYCDFMGSGTPFTSKPAAISGYYKYTDVATGDSAEVTVILKRYNTFTMKRDTIAYSTQALAASAGYTLFTVNLTDLMPGVSPDSIIIMFNSSKYYMCDTISWGLPALYIDRINLPETPMSIAENENSLISSVVFPNPFSESATLVIDTEMSHLTSANLSIFDVNGKKVLNFDKITSNRIQIQKQSLANGSYFYKVKQDNQLISQGKFTVQ